jgi:NADH dehydrogenase
LERVVIVGAGFAGLAAARRLAGSQSEVYVLDQNNFHTFQPLLYEVATAGLDPADVAYPVRTIIRKADDLHFVHGRASRIDLDGRCVEIEDGASLGYDHLLVATGASVAFFGVPGAAEHALPLYTLDGARRVRNEVLTALEQAERAPSGAAAIVVVGGGPTGVETAGALSELIDIVVRHDRVRLDPRRSHVVLLDARHRLLAGFTPRAGLYAEQMLRSRRRRSPARRGRAVGVPDRGGPRGR